MDDGVLDRSFRFAAFLFGGVLLLVFAVEYLVTGIAELAVQCGTNGFGSFCMGIQIWQFLAPVIAGGILFVLALYFFFLARALRRPGLTPPPPPLFPPPP